MSICASCRPGLGLRPVRPCAAGDACGLLGGRGRSCFDQLSARPGLLSPASWGRGRKAATCSGRGSGGLPAVLPVSICASCRPGLGLRPVRPCAAGDALAGLSPASWGPGGRKAGPACRSWPRRPAGVDCRSAWSAARGLVLLVTICAVCPRPLGAGAEGLRPVRCRSCGSVWARRLVLPVTL